jgi:hypothetical protein
VRDEPAIRPIEQVAAALRDLQRAMRVMAATPDALTAGDDERVRVLSAYDRWLLEAARLAQVPVPVEPGEATLLRPERRCWLEDRLVDLGWRFEA